MTRSLPYLFIFLLLAVATRAQTPADSLPSLDTAAAIRNPIRDTSAPKPVRHKRPIADSLHQSLHVDSLSGLPHLVLTDSVRFSDHRPALVGTYPPDWMGVLASNGDFGFLGKGTRVREERYGGQSYDGLFYLLVGMLFFFAIVRLAFGKYLGNLLTLFFRVSMRQQQIRDQVLQSPFPSLLLNSLFFLSGGLYAAFFLLYEGYAYPDQFWLFFVYACLVLVSIYLIKFIFLRVAGWIFNISKTAEIYLFVVFMTNKIIGIFLLPFLVMLSFSGHLMSMVCFTLSAFMIGIFYVYRIVASFKTLRKEIKISGLHFILYLCAFEIAPLLLIYKVLLTYLGKAH